jgi:hypothetical protein
MTFGVRPVARLIELGVLAMLLTGCIKVDLGMRLHTDNTIDGTMIYAVSRDLLTLTHSSADDLLNQVASGGPLPAGIQYQTTPYSDDTFVGQTLTFENVPITAFQQGSVGGESLSIQRVGDTFQVSGTIDLTRSTAGPLQPGAAQLAKTMQLRLAITFPGPVQQQTGGTVEGNTVTWTPTYGTKTVIQATGSALGDSSQSGVTWILLGVAAIVVVIIVVLVLIRRRRRAAPELAPSNATAAASVDRPDPPATP